MNSTTRIGTYKQIMKAQKQTVQRRAVVDMRG